MVRLQSQHSRQARPKADDAVPSVKFSGATTRIHHTEPQHRLSQEWAATAALLHGSHYCTCTAKAPAAGRPLACRNTRHRLNLSYTEPLAPQSWTACVLSAVDVLLETCSLWCVTLYAPQAIAWRPSTKIQCTCAPSFTAASTTGLTCALLLTHRTAL